MGTMKKCTKCKKEKTLDSFYKQSDGQFGRAQPCKMCKNANSTLYNKTHPDVIKKASRKWYQGNKDYYKDWAADNYEKIKLAANKYHKNHPEKERQRNKKFRENNPSYQKEWAKDNKGRLYEYSKKHRLKYPEKALAHAAVRYAVKIGKLKRIHTLKCSHCESQAAHYHHYKGYAKQNQLNVIPLCRKCHKIADGQD